MNKKVILLLLIVLLAAGGAAGFYWWQTQEKSKEVEQLKEQQTSTKWNLYAKEDKYMHTLTDFLISAGGGEYVVKMTVTLDFKDGESYYKFLGYKTKEEGEEGVASGVEEDAPITPMEIAINDGIGQLVLDASDEQIYDKEKLKEFLLENLYKKLALNENIFEEIFIENYVVQ